MSQTNNVNRAGAVKIPPALDPERPELVQPWRTFVNQGLVKSVKFERTPIGMTCVAVVDPQLLGLEEHQTEVSPGLARDAILKKGLWIPPAKGGKQGSDSKNKEALPKKSICLKDFEGNDASFLNRARSVANTLGAQTARGRVGSMELQIEGCDQFDSWWKAASGKAKARLLTDKKHFDEMTDSHFARVDKVIEQCPFRGPVPTTEKEEAVQKEIPQEAKGKGKSKTSVKEVGPSKSK